ncbi:MAG: serine/threonine-protein kinase [Polyangiaceae bacterium]
MALGSLFAGKYKIERQIGDGGMGTVYEAAHEMLGTKVAIKILHRELLDRSGLVDRFLQEAKVAAEIRNPHVVHVSDVGKAEDGSMFMVMELLHGEPLSSVLDREGKLPAPLACEYVRQILLALEAAHALGVVHRDLKPENVFLTMEGGKPVLKLIDFGIAKLRRERALGEKNLTVAGVMMGTAEYMAPEQAFSADQADARSDIYAAGVMLYEMLSGTRPVTGVDPRVIATRVVRGEATPLVRVAPDVKPELAGLVHRAMAPNPELRFSSAADMRAAIEAVMPSQGSSIPAAMDGPTTARLKPPTIAGSVARVDAIPGTGTVLGAPVPAALAPSMAPPLPPASLAPYAPTPLAMPAAHGGGAPVEVRSAPPPAHAPRRSKTPLWPFFLIALILGASAVVVYVVWQASLDGVAPSAEKVASPTAPPPSAPSVTQKASATAEPPASTLAQLTSASGLSPTPPPPSTAKPPATQPTQPAPPTPGTLAPPAALTLPTSLPTTLPFPAITLPTSLPFPPAPPR